MSKTSSTFPSNWEALNADKLGNYMEPKVYGFSTNYMNDDSNQLWNEQMKDNRERVMARLRNNRNKTDLYDEGGWYYKGNIKNQPQGSFSTPLNLSGSTSYGLKNTLLGGARTSLGREYESNLLKQRAQQLQEIQMASETGQSLAPTVAPSTELESVRTTLDLLISNINNQFMSGEFNEMKKEDINKIYGTLKEDGQVLPSSDIKRYYEIFQNMRETIEQLLASNDNELKKRLVLLMPQNVGLAVFKIAVLLRVLISVKQFSPEDQRTLINSISSQLLKAKDRQQIFNIDEGLYNRFQALEAPSQRLLTDAEAVSQAVDITKQAQQRFRSRKALEKIRYPAELKTFQREAKALETELNKINNEISRIDTELTGDIPNRRRGTLTNRRTELINERGMTEQQLTLKEREIEDTIAQVEDAPIGRQEFIYSR
jgi:hypothetical protein